MPLPPERRQLVQRGLQHPVGEGTDQACVFRQGNELIRREEATLRMVPAHQRLKPHHALTAVVDLRLIVKAQLIRLDGFAQLALDGEIAAVGVCLFRRIQRIALARAFCHIHRDVGAANQPAGIGALGGDRAICPGSRRGRCSGVASERASSRVASNLFAMAGTPLASRSWISTTYSSPPRRARRCRRRARSPSGAARLRAAVRRPRYGRGCR